MAYSIKFNYKKEIIECLNEALLNLRFSKDNIEEQLEHIDDYIEEVRDDVYQELKEAQKKIDDAIYSIECELEQWEE